MSVLRSVMTGAGAYLPEKRVTNEDLTRIVETTDAWITERTGIRARHQAAADQSTSDLAVEAARAALADAGRTPADVDLIIVATTTPDLTFPAVAAMVQRKIGAPVGIAFDVQAVCSGFIYGLHLADSLIRSGANQRVLVIGAETFSRILNFQDRTTCVLFGDGAGAVILEASDEPGILSTALHADGSYRDILCVPGATKAGEIEGSAFLKMDGQAVFKLAVKVLEQVANEVLEKAHLSSSQIDWLIPHQANIRIMEGAAKKLGIATDHVIVTLASQGNTSAASIPLALDDGVRSGKVKPGHHLLLEGVGGGFTWGAACIRF